jgi:hypothetical protein
MMRFAPAPQGRRLSRSMAGSPALSFSVILAMPTGVP